MGAIAVAVSGGADSLYSLLDLKSRGFSVIALHGLFFPPRDTAEEREKEAAIRGLERHCLKLGVPLRLLDLSREFRDLVIRPFVEAYARGLTPNPCALCNQRIKFGLLQDAALALGAEKLATGHYARLEPAFSKEGRDVPALLQGEDALKDQSYFLALTPLARLAKALFPLGGLRKQNVLQSLTAQGAAVPQPGESQEVCFVPNDAYRDFLPRMADELGIALPGPGPMLLTDGRRVGSHKGLWRYTEGQRKGLGIGWSEALHVLGKEMEGNVLRLGPRREMKARGCVCEDTNILLPPDRWPGELLVKTRYREKPKPAQVSLEPACGAQGPQMRILFDQPESAVAPGQVAAVYAPWPEEHGETLRLAAGGIIREAL